MTPDLAAIKRRAEAASKVAPGPWESGPYKCDVWMPSEKGGQTKIVDIRGWGYFTGKGSGALGLSEDEGIQRQQVICDFIAACDPTTVLALLTALSAAEAKVRELEAALRPVLEMPVDNAELLRIRNKCEHVEGDVKIWSRMLQTIVDAVRVVRTAAAMQKEKGG